MEEHSLEDDLGRLLENQDFHDITIVCSDKNTLGASKNILAARSNVFYNKIIDRINDQKFTYMEFDNINSTTMKFILKYLYTSKILEETLYNVENIIELYYAAIFFELSELQTQIVKSMIFHMEINGEELVKKLLSQFVVKFPSLETENKMSQLLIESVAKIHLNLEKDSLSLKGLRYLLCKTLSAKIPFATHEIDLFNCVIDKFDEVDKYSLLPYIDLRRFDSDTLVNVIEPLKLFPQDRIMDAYRFKAQENGKNLKSIRGIPIFRWKGYNNNDSYNNSLSISKDGFTLEASRDLNNYAHKTTDFSIKGNGIYKWSISVETNRTCYIGICENTQLHKAEDYCGWVLGSSGYIYHENDSKWYDAKFKTNDVVTVILNMTEKTCEFLINGKTTGVITGWVNLPSEVYPFVSLKKGCKLRIIQDETM
ncbi:10933_t:CDS:1 [Funneliformis mosseae]|uniref:10933_t:CDS:1 n=1 Tax=Funneliformis mosseae TaxID=27381 RepID=A0A9N9GNJ6_FUNMO|nr:10933_t:CDS:1 [Funneliformis mosseae]